MFVLLVALALSAMTAQATDPFQSGKPSSTIVAISLPTWMAGPIAAVAKIQRDLNETISSKIREVKETHSRRELAVILLLAFAYGVFHALGPGHGKMVVASYLMARRERIVDGIIVGSLISVVQGLSAIVMVGVLALVLQLGQLEVFGQTTLVEAVSYALIALIGLRMFHQAVTRKAARPPSFPRRDADRTGDDSAAACRRTRRQVQVGVCRRVSAMRERDHRHALCARQSCAGDRR
jgi:nickel/cobalt exporter